ncbi:unnamed protein product [Clavelina lepadiformis]|uniref:C2H2-type domain-containing protein n=1 Tax=Clavelina lepadiformis TaxID=159417 RepID=A0ABP0FH61_CLALP
MLYQKHLEPVRNLAIQVKQEVVEETVPALSTTAQALRVKLENIAEVLDNYQVDSVPEYCIDDLQVLDGASLLKLFTKYELSNNGVSQYRCQISSHDCDRVYAGHDQKECREVMISHLLEHVKTYREKAAKYPHFYKKKRLKPCQPIIVKSEPDYSDYNDPVASQPLPSKQQNAFASASLMNPIIARLTTEVSRSNIVALSDTTDLPNIDILPDMETERLLSIPDPKEALMSAVSLKRNQNTSQSNLDDAKKKSINTRGSRKKIIQERNRILHQRRQERIRKHFSNQPRVVIRDVVKSRLPLEPKPVENPLPLRNYRPIRPKPADGSIPTPPTSNRYVEKKVPPRKRKKPSTHVKQVKAKKAPSRPPPPPSSEDSSSSEDDGSSEQDTTDTDEKPTGKYSFQLPRKKTLMSSLRNNRERRLRMMRAVQGPKIKKEKVDVAKINTQNSDSTIKTGDNSEILQVQPAKLEPSTEPSSNCLPSSLKDRKQFPPKRHLPSILRRNKPKPLHKNDNIASIQIKECMSLATEEIMSTKGGNDSSSGDEIVDVVSKSSPKPSPSLPISPNENDSDSTSSEDIGSDSSCWSDKEDPMEVNQKSFVSTSKKKSPRKQHLTVKEDKLFGKPTLRDILEAIDNDHCYTVKREMAVDPKGFIKLMTPKNSESSQVVSQGKQQIKVHTHKQKSDEFKLNGPSSRKIEPATDPKIKARALQLIAELRHRKPKEVMVCTERMIEDGESAFIVQDFYTCEICGKRFTAPNSLYGHYRGHAGIKPYKCHVCGQTFTRSHSLNYHAMIHTNSARFECSYCGRKFRHPTHYKEHLHRHTGEEPYHCTDCPRRFKTRNTFRRHMIAKHNKKITPTFGLPLNSRIVKTMPAFTTTL